MTQTNPLDHTITRLEGVINNLAQGRKAAYCSHISHYSSGETRAAVSAYSSLIDKTVLQCSELIAQLRRDMEHAAAVAELSQRVAHLEAQLLSKA